MSLKMAFHCWKCIVAGIFLASCAAAPSSPPQNAAGSPKPELQNDVVIDEQSAWEAVKASEDPVPIQRFLEQFPSSKHAASAKLRLKLIARGTIGSHPSNSQ